MHSYLYIHSLERSFNRLFKLLCIAAVRVAQRYCLRAALGSRFYNFQRVFPVCLEAIEKMLRVEYTSRPLSLRYLIVSYIIARFSSSVVLITSVT
jgi:hypothetical protein